MAIQISIPPCLWEWDEKFDDDGVVATQIYVLFSTPVLGEMIQFDKHIFSDGLKPPTR